MTSPMFWDGVLRRLGAEVPPFVIDAWVRPLVVEAAGRHLRLLCPSALHRERVRARFLARIAELAEAEAGTRLEVELCLGAPAPTRPVSAAAPAPPRTPGAAVSGAPSPPAEPVQRELPYTFENFVVGPCNRLAREAAFAVAEERQRTANPLFLTAASGLGKTHLARAVAAAAGRGRRVIYSSAEAFTNQFTDALRAREMDRFKRRYRRSCDLLVLEDVQFLASKRATQLELFHTLTHLVDAGSRVLLTGDRLPREVAGLDERLGSRMAAGLVAELEPPDALVRREILRARAARGGVRLPEDCLDLLVDAVRGSVRDLESILVQLVTSASLLERPIDLELTRWAVQKLFGGSPPPTRRLSVDRILPVVAAFYRTTPEALAARSRRRDVVVPRQIAMYLCRRYTDESRSAIARAFARRHPSVRNAEQVVEQRMLASAPFRYRVEAVAARLAELEREGGAE